MTKNIRCNHNWFHKTSVIIFWFLFFFFFFFKKNFHRTVDQVISIFTIMNMMQTVCLCRRCGKTIDDEISVKQHDKQSKLQTDLQKGICHDCVLEIKRLEEACFFCESTKNVMQMNCANGDMFEPTRCFVCHTYIKLHGPESLIYLLDKPIILKHVIKEFAKEFKLEEEPQQESGASSSIKRVNQ